MTDHFADFDRRIKGIERQSARMKKGYTYAVQRDGLIVMKPKRRGLYLPLRGLLAVGMAVFAMKVLFIAVIGTQAYDYKVQGLSEKSELERAGAWVMQRDPLTNWIVETAQLDGIMR